MDRARLSLFAVEHFLRDYSKALPSAYAADKRPKVAHDGNGWFRWPSLQKSSWQKQKPPFSSSPQVSLPAVK